MGWISKARRVALVAALALMASACYRTGALDVQAHDPNSRPWWCHSELMPDEHGAQWYLDHGITKGDLSWDDCLAVSDSFDKAFVFALQWPTRGQAEAAGWRASTPYAPGMGTHHALGSPIAGTFDPTRPTFLQYGGNGPEARLVGISWYVSTPNSQPPDGFPGDNDWWHQHLQLCMSNETGLIIYDGPCPPGVNGNTVSLGNLWLLHAWIVPGWQHTADVFTGHHPCLFLGGPATPDDECWTDPMHSSH